jgi:prevent-host-death family protein
LEQGVVSAAVGTFEAKTHFSELLERVSKGEEITITRHGAPVAKLVPVAAPSRRDLRTIVEKLKAFREGKTLDGISWKELRDEGRKY